MSSYEGRTGTDRFAVAATTSYSITFPSGTHRWSLKLEPAVPSGGTLRIGTSQARVVGTNYASIAAGETFQSDKSNDPIVYVRNPGSEAMVVQVVWERARASEAGPVTVAALA